LKKNFVRGITIAHNIIIVDLGKESSLPLKYLKSPITKEKKKKRFTKEKYSFRERDLKMLDGSDFWLESSSTEGLHVRIV